VDPAEAGREPRVPEDEGRGQGLDHPLKDSFGKWPNLKLVILALFGLAAGQAVVWYTGQFYALFFLEKILKVDGALANTLMAIALLLATPFFVFWGWLSDKVGRKPVILAGCLIAALTYFPAVPRPDRRGQSASGGGDGLGAGHRLCRPRRLLVPVRSHRQEEVHQSCDLAKNYLAKAGVTYSNVAAPAGTVAQVRIGSATVSSFRALIVEDQWTTIASGSITRAEFATRKTAFETELGAALKAAGYPAKADSALVNRPLTVAILFALVFYVTMVYGPIAAALVEMFPTNIRYTSMSLPYHIGNGWFGGFLPTTAFAMVAASGNIYHGLWYPIVIAVITAVVGFLFVKEGKDVDIHA
jgi:hypothetical protein